MRPITESKFLTDSERERLLATLEKDPSRDSLLLQLVLYTGGRGCEVISLSREAFNFNGQVSVTLKGAKGSNDRTIPLPARLGRLLAEYMKTCGEGKPFQITTRRLRQIWDFYRPNPTKGIHCLRHTSALLLYINCRDIMLVKAYLGHRNIQNTLVYLEFVMGARELRNKMHGMWSVKISDVA